VLTVHLSCRQNALKQQVLPRTGEVACLCSLIYINIYLVIHLIFNHIHYECAGPADLARSG
jgi:uncharacterized membrane protein YhdT